MRVALRRADALRADLLAAWSVGERERGSRDLPVGRSGGLAKGSWCHRRRDTRQEIAVPDIHKQFDEHGGLVDQKPSHVAYVTGELNERPRKGLGYDTPAARFATETATIPTPLG